MEQERDEEELVPEKTGEGADEGAADGAENWEDHSAVDDIEPAFDFASTGTADREVDPKKRPVIYLVALLLLALFALPFLWLLITLLATIF